MNYFLILKPEAERDLLESLEWYDDQRAGLGKGFLLEVEKTFDRILENPSLYAIVHRDVRRALTRRFPYAVFFVIEDDAIVVLGVLHSKRDPVQWQERRKGR